MLDDLQGKVTLRWQRTLPILDTQTLDVHLIICTKALGTSVCKMPAVPHKVTEAQLRIKQIEILLFILSFYLLFVIEVFTEVLRLNYVKNVKGPYEAWPFYTLFLIFRIK